MRCAKRCCAKLPFRLLVCLGLTTLASFTASGPAPEGPPFSTAGVFLGAAFLELSFLLGLRTCFWRRGGSVVVVGGGGFGGAAFGGEGAALSPRMTDGDGNGSGLPSAIEARP